MIYGEFGNQIYTSHETSSTIHQTKKVSNK
uniref:Uncharacterized protein n=1 Tax=viral metagenome TaxID=1070528 RepID=A0A6C0CWA3_9ZZZZ